MKPKTKRVLLGVLLLLTGARMATALSLEQVSDELVCQCGCGLVLTNCNHSDCGVAIPMREIITQRILGGETREQIVASFVVQYGEIVLAAPTKEGFNLTVWVLPFAGIAVGCGVIAILIVRWTRRRRESIIPEDAQEIQDDTPDEYVKIFDRELEEFDQ